MLVPLPVSDQCEHFCMVLCFSFCPCAGPGFIPIQCEYTITHVSPILLSGCVSVGETVGTLVFYLCVCGGGGEVTITVTLWLSLESSSILFT